MQSIDGLRAFGLLWLGQLVSLVGTRMTQFALLIWVWDQTGEATPLAIISVLSSVPTLVARFFAGSLVDRWNRRRVMIVADSAAGAASLCILLLFSSGQLQVWHLFITAVVVGIAGTFQGLAYATSLSLLLPKQHFARARGLISLSQYASLVGAPLLGGVLVTLAGVGGVLVLDLLTFLVAIALLLQVRIPQPPASPRPANTPLWRDALLGYQYILQRRGLFGLLGITLAFAFAESLSFPLIGPMLLARTGGDELSLGTVMAVQGAGGIVGSLVFLAWGGPKRAIHGVLLGVILTGLLGDVLMGMGQSLPVWLLAALGIEVFVPMLMGAYHSIWMSKVDPALQGRVFAARDVVASVGEPVAQLSSGLLADNLFEPAMLPDGSLAPLFGGLVGVGPGAGMGLIMVFGGLLTAAAGLSGYLFRSVREVEAHLPDAPRQA